METLADFGVVSLFNYSTFTTAIYSAWGDFRSVEVAAQLASLLVLVSFFLIYFERKAREKLNITLQMFHILRLTMQKV